MIVAIKARARLIFSVFLALALVLSEIPVPALRSIARAAEGESDIVPAFSGLVDPDLLEYVDDVVYAGLEEYFAEQDYLVYGVQSVYLSQEYLEELAYNSQQNIFFGSSLAELDEEFEGTRYVFTLGEDGQTVVCPFESYDDSYDQMIRNVAVGAGVILVCAVVEVVAAGTGTLICVIFAGSAKAVTGAALTTGAISGTIGAIMAAREGENPEEIAKSSALAASEGFKWGAISGALLHVPANWFDELRLVRWLKTEEPLKAGKAAEQSLVKRFGRGRTQVSYLAGQEVGPFAEGAVRPDLVRTIDGHLEAIEFKRCDLANQINLRSLCNTLEKQVSNRLTNLPGGMTQRIVLDVRGRGYSTKVINDAVSMIRNRLNPIYPDIPIDVVRF